jgi:hypothetical protein
MAELRKTHVGIKPRSRNGRLQKAHERMVERRAWSGHARERSARRRFVPQGLQAGRAARPRAYFFPPGPCLIKSITFKLYGSGCNVLSKSLIASFVFATTSALILLILNISAWASSASWNQVPQ